MNGQRQQLPLRKFIDLAKQYAESMSLPEWSEWLDGWETGLNAKGEIVAQEKREFRKAVNH